MGYWDRDCREERREGERDYERFGRPNYERSRYGDGDGCYFNGYDEAEAEDRRRREQRAEEEAAEERAHARRMQERRDEEAYYEELEYRAALEAAQAREDKKEDHS
jgi:hypothetical protein